MAHVWHACLHILLSASSALDQYVVVSSGTNSLADKMIASFSFSPVKHPYLLGSLSNNLPCCSKNSPIDSMMERLHSLQSK